MAAVHGIIGDFLGKQIRPVNLGTRQSFADVAATVADMLNVPFETPGKSFANQII